MGYDFFGRLGVTVVRRGHKVTDKTRQLFKKKLCFQGNITVLRGKMYYHSQQIGF